MTIAEFMATLLKHNVNLNKKIFVVTNAYGDAEKCYIEESPCALYLIPHEYAENTHHFFLDEEGEK